MQTALVMTLQRGDDLCTHHRVAGRADVPLRVVVGGTRLGVRMMQLHLFVQQGGAESFVQLRHSVQWTERLV